MKTFVLSICCLVSLMFFAGVAYSDDYARSMPRYSKEHKEKIRKRIKTLKMWQLTETLELNEQKAAKIFPIINKYDNKRFKVRRLIRKDMSELKRSVDTANEKRLKEIILKLENSHKMAQEIDKKEMDTLKSMLSVRDTARFIIFRHKFDKDMKKIIYEAKEKRMRRAKDTRNKRIEQPKK